MRVRVAVKRSIRNVMVRSHVLRTRHLLYTKKSPVGDFLVVFNIRACYTISDISYMI
jgi:hypothetical protein